MDTFTVSCHMFSEAENSSKHICVLCLWVWDMTLNAFVGNAQLYYRTMDMNFTVIVTDCE